MKKKLCLLLLTCLLLSQSLFSKETEILWVFLKQEYLEMSSGRMLTYNQKTRQRLAKVNWQTGPSDYLPNAEIRVRIEKEVIKLRHYSRSLGAYSVEIRAGDKKKLTALPFVSSVREVRFSTRRKDTFYDLQSTGLLKSNDFYGKSGTQLEQLNILPVHAMGITGKGVRVGMLDTGFMTDHEVFSYMIENGRLMSQWDFINNDNNTQDEAAIDSVAGNVQHDHGTAAFSCLAGYMPNIHLGAAYDVEMLLAKTEIKASETRIEEDHYVAGIEWLEANGADIISSSLGYRDFDDFEYPFSDFDGKTGVTTQAVNWAYERGVVFVTAAGNDASRFSDGGLIMPADARGALTVGAVNSNGNIASFSSHGPTYDGRIKPEVCAMGYNTHVAITCTPTSYRFSNGTSFATPLIAGSCALILEKYPFWTPEMVIWNLKNFSDRSDDPDNMYGWGIPNIYRLITETPDSVFNYPEVPTRDIMVAPNPVCVKDYGERAKIYFKWTLPESDNALSENFEVSIYDLLGKKVYSQKLVQKAIGEIDCVVWNLKNFCGNNVSSGIYLVKVSGKKMNKLGKLTIVK
ncbi:MAG: S8 family peptidase [Candidatus Marinimicrobia bacterium]|nr:S8 family peptidase [Candidatus Neomarinimicrobiota bacterium]